MEKEANDQVFVEIEKEKISKVIVEIDKTKEDTTNDMIVYATYKYTKTVNEKDQMVINNVFVIYEELGEGSYWKAFKVKRNYKKDDFIDDNWYVFKEGVLSVKDDEAVFNKMNHVNCCEDLDCNFDKEAQEVKLGVREYNILKDINFKHIARLYECIIDSAVNKIIFVMEYCDLGTLMSFNKEETGLLYNNKLFDLFIKNNLFDCRSLLEIKDKEKSDEIFASTLNICFSTHSKFLIRIAHNIFTQLALSIEYLHGRKIAHRDLKMDNIMLRSNEEETKFDLKLIDFSISRRLKSLDDNIESSQGTNIFKPIEMTEEYEHNPFKVDIYNFGTTLYVFLFNWDEKCTFDLNCDNANELKKIDIKLFEILEKCLNPNPNKRPTIKEVLDLLK